MHHGLGGLALSARRWTFLLEQASASTSPVIIISSTHQTLIYSSLLHRCTGACARKVKDQAASTASVGLAKVRGPDQVKSSSLAVQGVAIKDGRLGRSRAAASQRSAGEWSILKLTYSIDSNPKSTPQPYFTHFHPITVRQVACQVAPASFRHHDRINAAAHPQPSRLWPHCTGHPYVKRRHGREAAVAGTAGPTVKTGSEGIQLADRIRRRIVL